MVDSIQGLLILVLTMPGFFGYLCFNRFSDGCVDDAFEKIGIVVGLNVGAIFVATLLGHALPANLLETPENLRFEGVLSYVAGSLVTLTIIAVALGWMFAALVNWSWLSNVLVRMRLTRKSGAHSVLADVIRSHPDSFFRLYLKGGGYVSGHPRRYSLDGKETMLFLDKAAIGKQSAEDGKWSQRTVHGAGIVLLNFEEVGYVELV